MSGTAIQFYPLSAVFVHFARTKNESRRKLIVPSMAASSSVQRLTSVNFRDLTDIIIHTSYEERPSRHMMSWNEVINYEFGLHIMPLTCAGRVIATEACRTGLLSRMGLPDNDEYNVIIKFSAQLAPNPNECRADHVHHLAYMDDSGDEYDMSENALITTSEYCEPRWIQRDMLEDIPILKEGDARLLFNDGILWSRDPYLDRGDSSHPDDSVWGARNSDCAERLRISDLVKDACFGAGLYRYFDEGMHYALHNCFAPLDLIESMSKTGYCACMHSIMEMHYIHTSERKILIVRVDAESG